MSPPDSPVILHTVAAVIVNGVGEVLLVRKRGSAIFIQPGGKKEPGEVPLQTLARELREELGVEPDPASVRRLGRFQAPAVNEPGCLVRADAYCCRVIGEPLAQAEIAELRWLRMDGELDVTVAPLSRLHILPAFAALNCDEPPDGVRPLA
ncbi:MAG: NUDIX domain-containing protein [Lysobacteraceae bacterium]